MIRHHLYSVIILSLIVLISCKQTLFSFNFRYSLHHFCNLIAARFILAYIRILERIFIKSN